jgi:hypothetical protein
MQLPSRSVLIVLAIGLTSCSQEQPGYTEKERLCIAQHYKDYDPKQLIQCVDVCKACLSGTAATCNTSCKLKGAT